ncbi:hypothetical protein Tco_0883039, partial [Tanacetum coccineum]
LDNDVEGFKNCIRSIRTVHSKLFDRDDGKTTAKDKGAQRGQPSSPQEISIEEKVRRLGVFEDGVHQIHFDTLARRRIHSRDVIDWEFLAHHNLEQEFFNSISTDPFSWPQWGNLFRVNEPIYRELVREFFALFNFDASPSRFIFSWAIYKDTTLSRLRDCNTVREDRLLMEFWPRSGERMFNGMREKNLIYGGMLVTRIARLLGLLTNEWRSALSVEPQPHVFKKKSLIAIGVIMELHDGMCVWPGNMAVEEEDDKGDDEGDEGAGGDAG